MTNAYFKSISDYRDIEAINAYKEYTESGLMTEEEMLNCLKMISRDNARRTPMQWDDSANAGFSTGTPWISVNKKSIHRLMQKQHWKTRIVYSTTIRN